MPSRYRKITIAGRTISYHRYVWEQAHGPIPAGHVIHHRDGDRFNNDLSNLELMTHQQHSAEHNQKHPTTKQCVVCGATFTPHPTKRATKRSCSRTCFAELQRQHAYARAARKKEAA